MGRRPGVSAEQTRAQLLAAAAGVFARRGYQGATIAEIADEAKLSSGSIYAHYRGKAQLFLAVLESHARSELARRLHDGSPIDVSDFLTQAGARLEERPAVERTLIIEAVMAAKQDPEVKAALSKWFADQHDFLASSLRSAQKAGDLDDGFDPSAAARFAAAVMLGSIVLDVLDVPKAGAAQWGETIHRVVGSFEAPARTR